MDTIRKTWKKATYFYKVFKLRKENNNWAHPIGFPVAFIAYGAAIRSGNWQQCTGINTPQYVIDNYFDGKKNIGKLGKLWEYCEQLSNLTWDDVREKREEVMELINLANKELEKLPLL